MTYYGYIILLKEFTPAPNDIQWVFKRYNEDGSQTEYNGIETDRDLSQDNNVVIVNNFNKWVNEFHPPII